MKAVLEKVNARRALQSDGVHNFEEEPLYWSGTTSGWVARLEKGKLELGQGGILVHSNELPKRMIPVISV